MVRLEREDDGKKGRFVIYENGEEAGQMTFTWAGETMFIIDHTEVDPSHGGKGYGRMLVMEAVTFARDNGLKIMPLCTYAKSVFDKTEDIRDVLFS